MIRIGSFISRRWASRNALLVTVRNGESTDAFKSVSSSLNSTFEDQLQAAGGLPKTGQVRNFFNASEKYPIVTVVGHCDKNNSSSEGRDEERENIRKAIANGIKSLNDYNIDNVAIATDGCALAAGEAAQMTIWNYKQEKIDKMPKSFSLYDSSDDCSSCSIPKNESFDRGLLLGDAQNLARHLMELPSNMLTPSIFAEKAKNELEPLGVKVNIYDSDWIKDQNMNAFWSVAKGSSEPPKMVEMIYEGPESEVENTFCLIGKGVTFDSGGISIKPSASMGDMRADMGGAAVTVAAMKAIAAAGLKGRIVALTPLAENMPAGNASKPGDVVVARNGKTIQIDNTDAEGRLLLCDTLDYAAEVHKPTAMIDSATLTGAMVIALGSGCTGVFCKSNTLWSIIEKSGFETGDRAWRMPHYQHYFDSISPTHNADLNNTGGREAGSATAAGFLSAFVPEDIPWAHFDIAGVMDTKGTDGPYLSKGMTGRPTRTLFKIIENYYSK